MNLSEFDTPPVDPFKILLQWFQTAWRDVREPAALALATTDSAGKVSNRIVQVIELTDAGLVFASHTGSQKGRDIGATGRASGVLFWRETGQQVILTGPVEQEPDARSDALWASRPPATHPMSVLSRQSEPLEDEEALREQARLLLAGATPLPRPPTWVGYQLVPSTVEFWQGSPDRLHRRLRYNRVGEGWTSTRLQP